MGLSQSSSSPPMSVEEARAFGLNDLHLAVRNRDLETVKALLETREELADEFTNDGYSVFHLAACSSSFPIFLLLTSSSVARTVINSLDHRGFAPVHLLVSQQRQDMLEHALYLLDVNLKTKLGMNCLHLSAASPKMLKLLADGGCRNCCDVSGRLALHVAAALGHTESVSVLCKLFPESIDELSQDGASALMLSCKNNHPDVCSVLLSLGANPSNRGGFGATALHRAVEVGSVECVRLLCYHDPALVLLRDDDGMTPLHYLAGSTISRPLLQEVSRKPFFFSSSSFFFKT